MSTSVPNNAEVAYLEALDKAYLFIAAARDGTLQPDPELVAKVALRMTREQAALDYLDRQIDNVVKTHPGKEWKPFNQLSQEVKTAIHGRDIERAQECLENLDAYYSKREESLPEGTGEERKKKEEIIQAMAPYQTQISYKAHFFLEAVQFDTEGGVVLKSPDKKLSDFMITSPRRLAEYLQKELGRPVEQASASALKEAPLTVGQMYKDFSQALTERGFDKLLTEALEPATSFTTGEKIGKAALLMQETAAKWAYRNKLTEFTRDINDTLRVIKSHPEFAKQPVFSFVLKPSNWKKSKDQYVFPSLPHFNRAVAAVLQSELNITAAASPKGIAITAPMFAQLEKREMVLENTALLMLNQKGANAPFPPDERGNVMIMVPEKEIASFNKALGILSTLNVPYERKSEKEKDENGVEREYNYSHSNL